MRWLSRLFNRNNAAPARIAAKVDLARPSVDSDRHWAGADALSARAAYSPEVRRTIRERARYETLNNSYASGILRTLAHHTIGTGPRLQVTGIDPQRARDIEAAFAEWCKQTKFCEGLIAAKQSQVRDGEVFALLGENKLYDVPLNIRWIEADQCQSPYTGLLDTSIEDGIRIDANGEPVGYHFLRHHPGGVTFAPSLQGDWYPAEEVLHYFRKERVGQVRGISDLTPALDLFATLRRYSRATLLAAETAANVSLYVKTTGPAVTAASVGADMPTFEMQRNVMQFLPEGWEPFQLKPEHPATTHEMFVRATINEIARCVSMPYNIAACNSSGYNYSSGRLDHQTYYRAIELDRAMIEGRICDRVFRAWLQAAFFTPLLTGLLPSQIKHSWEWDGAPVIDEQADAAAGMARIQSGRSTLALEYQRQGYGDAAEQIAKGAELLGMSIEQYQAALQKSIFGVEPGTLASFATQQPAQAAAPPAVGQFNTLNRRAWKNSTKAINDVLNDFATDGNRVMALTLLQKLGMSVEEANALLEDKADNGVVDQPLTAAAAASNLRLNASASISRDPARERSIEIVAYTGGILPVSGFTAPVVVDYSGLELPNNVPLLADHEDDLGSIVGQATSVVLNAGRLVVSGVVIPQSDAARQVLALHDSGFKWQASIGAHITASQEVPAGQSVEVNGQSFTGPVIVARRAALREVSLVAVGADAHTSATIAARAALLKGISNMTFEDWVKSIGGDPAALDDATRALMMTAYQQAQSAAAPTPAPVVATPAPAPVAAGNASPMEQPAMAANADINLKARREAAAAEWARELQIKRLCASHPEIGEKALREGWTADQTELHVLRAGLKHTHGGTISTHHTARVHQPQVLAAALCQSGRLKTVEKQFDDQTLQAAHTAFRGRISLKQFLLEAAWANGCDERHLTTATLRPVLRAAFSNAEISGILSNVSNKFLLEGFEQTEGMDVIEKIAGVKNVSDFKTMTMYRLIDGGEFEQVARDGHLTNGTLSEESFTISAKTYGKLYSLTREDIINDDLGALDRLRGLIGGGAARKLIGVFNTELLANHNTFFTSGKGNYYADAAAPLSLTSLAVVEKMFRERKTPQGTPLGLRPAYLLVPPALSVTAREIFVSENLALTSSSKIPGANVFRSLYEPVVNDYFTSSLEWYLVAAPDAMGALINVAYLNGQRTPTIESTDADFDTLGVQFRGYFDFGTAKQDDRYAVKSKGAA